jgi:hypothetical protein
MRNQIMKLPAAMLVSAVVVGAPALATPVLLECVTDSPARDTRCGWRYLSPHWPMCTPRSATSKEQSLHDRRLPISRSVVKWS